MELKRDVYRAFEDIVGPENISEDPAVLDGYIWQWMVEMMGELGNRWGMRPPAVLLPGSTEEVQAIVKLCNRTKLKYKAHSTGWGAFCTPGHEDVLMLDLRRMNRILEINEKDMYAVIEPYVIWATLQAETLKRGLNCCTIGAGSNVSALASITSFMGIGYNNYTMGLNNRNLLGAEWVLPDGEILNIGSLGSDCGWVSGDGPGPSIRGIIRGVFGALGGLGVFTKCAAKLYHWGGPSDMPVKNIGVHETVFAGEYPEHVALYYPFFENYEKRDEAFFRIAENEIGYSVSYMGKGMMCWLNGETNRDAAVLRENMIDMFPQYAFVLMLVCNSPREFEYQKKVVEKILEETGAVNPDLDATPEQRDALSLLLIKGGNIGSTVFQKTGSFYSILAGVPTSRGVITKTEKMGVKLKKKYVKEGVVVDDMGEGTWGSLLDFGHLGYSENETFFDPHDRKSCEAFFELQKDVQEDLEKGNLALPFCGQQLVDFPQGRSPHDTMGPIMDNYHLWQRKIKEAFDPNAASDSTMYIEPGEPEKPKRKKRNRGGTEKME